MQGPDQYLLAMGAALPCAVIPDRPATIDSDHRALVNHEVYYVSSTKALDSFMAEPWKYTGKVTDPVSRERFIPTKDSPQRSYRGRLFFLMSAETAATFDREPMTYGIPRPMMAGAKS